MCDQIGVKALAIWFMDDGSATIRNGNLLSVRFHTESFTKSTCQSLQRVLKHRFGLSSILSKSKKRYWVIRLNCESARQLRSLIIQHIHPSLNYKLGTNTNQEPKWDASEPPDFVQVLQVLPLMTGNQWKTKNQQSTCWDLEVEEAHNFIVRTWLNKSSSVWSKTGIVAHNCHTLERQLLKFGELTVSDKFLADWEVRLRSRPASEDPEDICAWLEECYIPQMEERKAAVQFLMEEGTLPRDKMNQATALINHVQKLSFTLTNMRGSPDNWVTWKETDPKKGEIINARPLDASPYLGLLTRSGAIRVYMSAYPGDKAVFCRSIGLDPPYVAWLTLDSTFPVDNRPIVMAMIGSMGKKNVDQTLPALLRTCDKILTKHTTQKGLIHVGSYRLGEQIVSHFASTPHALRLIFPKSAEEREDAFQKHKESPEPTVLVSPSMTEGFDFYDDLARWQIIAKIPYPYLGDRQVAAKKEQDPAWYDAQTVGTIIQSTGRIVRSETDRGVTYLLDSDFMYLWDRQNLMFPKWWREAMVWGKNGRSSS
jgi:Rad3-related DNA helicase